MLLSEMLGFDSLVQLVRIEACGGLIEFNLDHSLVRAGLQPRNRSPVP